MTLSADGGNVLILEMKFEMVVPNLYWETYVTAVSLFERKITTAACGISDNVTDTHVTEFLDWNCQARFGVTDFSFGVSTGLL